MLRFSHTNAADGTPTGGNYDPATHQITWTLETFGPGGQVELAVFGYVNGSVLPGTDLTNEVWVESAETTLAVAFDVFRIVAPEATATPSATATATATPTGTATPTDTATATPTSTPTATPRTHLVMSGHVYAAELGATAPISDAQVSLVSCLMEQFSATSAQDGSYQLIVPLTALATCTYASLEATAAGRESLKTTASISSLLAQPIVNFWLPERQSQPIRLPLLLRQGG